MDPPTPRFDQVPAHVQAAFEISHLGSLPAMTRDLLVSTSNLLTLPAGSNLHREGSEVAHLQLVASGLLRVYVTALDGRTLTVRYCRAGSLLGAVSLFASPFSMPASVQAVTDAEVLAMSAGSVKDLVERDPALPRALLDELSERVMSFISEIPSGAFATVRQRIARHLLDLASTTQKGAELSVKVSQQELAEAVGSVREVVVRTLRELREEGIVSTGNEGITLLDPVQLSAEAYPGRDETNVPRG